MSALPAREGVGLSIFGNQAATVPPFSPNDTVSMIRLSVQINKRTLRRDVDLG
jgi:hypothetical protein